MFSSRYILNISIRIVRIITQKIFPLQLLSIISIIMSPVYSRYAFIPTRRSGPVYTKFVPIYIPTDCIPMICSSIYQFPSIFAVFLLYSSYIPVCCCGYSLCSHILSIFRTFPITMSILTYYNIIFSVYSQYSQLWELHCIFPISTFPLYFHFHHISSRTRILLGCPYIGL